jgi:hypothetical protein
MMKLRWVWQCKGPCMVVTSTPKGKLPPYPCSCGGDEWLLITERPETEEEVRVNALWRRVVAAHPEWRIPYAGPTH